MRVLPSTLLLWLTVSRPFLYPLIPILFLLGYQAGGGTLMALDAYELLFVLALTWPVSMVLYGINDMYDFASDAQNASRNRIDGATVAPSESRRVWWGIGVAVLILLTAGLVAYGWFGVYFTVLVLVASILYSVPPFRLKNRAGADVIFSGLMYVTVMYSAGYVVVRPSELPPLEALILALAAIGLHALGALRDYTADRETGNKTIAVELGWRATTFIVILASLLGSLLWYLHRGFDIPTMLLFAVILFPALITLQKPNERLIKYAMWVIAGTAFCVGIYKLIY